ncbi:MULTISPECIES: tRNA (adenosine(37)-N6)-threonylcarbamoyltransferase complex dimerization subunit type 1 TsaB [Brevibacillus]|uniref:tRNA (adenosine(37)-N6)-threonylcarbamoyltransferase complex dimerization subunit type 1 TsaB n=1 Tax=Brevibacillus TaxID=55080 RepID=UPI000D1127FF|nr:MULTISPECIES: tRNA (adenosine(37)-N6)-threonylcarbamoyltransferase complex dimerization subunit type 1 TsaB [Brevibacillus]MED1948408.1 tRNA (adenosine(37)-N6)-threonylcarbamoyltransferase complex dimerization subunit type 1 TsaB [Brevibacillus formosus]MED1997648.1 tRNA (adenosine(37)-N6)-threonylcarbamoyltransferase complex dimerization subunit type 1 TsaB [Brevibacillus formosus]MED2083781.1 tRNA (adenosine(37)-N6)-threonylcarbamoyltransferase complex dimerization subunit type 1 TsaB [Brev
MRVLAIDTSNLVLSVAVVEEERVLAEMTTNQQKNHSVRLMDCVSELLDATGTAPEDLSGFGVANGPGSYTGVRIGVASAKSMAWSLNVPVIGVSSLEVIAMNATGFSGLIVPLFDARRGQVYTGCYHSDGMEAVRAQSKEQIILLREWLPLLRDLAQGEPILFLGEDVRLHRETIVQELGNQAQFASPAFNHPRAAHIGYVALRKLQDGGNAHELVPEYLQLAEAEAKWLAQKQAGAVKE